MYEKNVADVDLNEEVNKFVENYSYFSKIINKIQRQYLSLKETYSKQSEELQSVNQSLQSAMIENRAVNEFLDSILNSLASGVIAVDRSGYVTLVNPAARHILGLEANLNVGKTPYNDLIRAESNQESSALTTVKTGHPFENVEKKVKSLFGPVLTLSASTSLLKNRAGETVGAVELFFDITKLKRMEDQISQMKILASLGEMAASIAHEVRNPLVGIGGFASLLARDLQHDKAKRDMAMKIVEGVGNINQTIQTLLDFARREKVEKATVELNAYLDNIIDKFEENGSAKKGEVIRTYATDKNIYVDIDRQLFRQAIYNLIKNGLEVNRINPRVCIKTGIIPIKEAQAVYCERLGLSATETVAEIVVEDNGPGIDKKNISKIFSPFFSTKKNGTGLGLSIAWKIVKVHGGDLTAESQKGEGTKFSIVLPLKRELK
jgi:PAS domain S-box-containing protein